jgi:hypothetical protein
MMLYCCTKKKTKQKKRAGQRPEALDSEHEAKGRLFGSPAETALLLYCCTKSPFCQARMRQRAVCSAEGLPFVRQQGASARRHQHEQPFVRQQGASALRHQHEQQFVRQQRKGPFVRQRTQGASARRHQHEPHERALLKLLYCFTAVQKRQTKNKVFFFVFLSGSKGARSPQL